MQITNIGIIGSGDVGQTLANGFLQSGHNVKLGTREPDKLQQWLMGSGANASIGTFEEAAKFGEIIVLCVKGTAVREAIRLAKKKHFSNKVVIDVTNPLVFLKEKEPPVLEHGFPKSNGIIVQKMLPNSKVVKAFNTVTAKYMVNPRLQEGTPDLFICGDNEGKEKVRTIAGAWGWNVIDMGPIEQSYLLEALAMVWIRYGFLHNHWTHAFKLLRN